MATTERGSGLSAQERDQLETSCTFQRVAELEYSPVQGNFDAAHLREVNRRIFQDLPGLGFEDVKPGEFRPPVPDGKDWMKNRGLTTVEGSFYVAYSNMNEAAKDRLDRALERAKPEKLRGLPIGEFTAEIAKLYVELDYVHPFSDGNSRTLRTFTKQLAEAAGFEIDWNRFGQSETGRDLLYIARDLSVNALAKPHIEHEQSMRKIVHSMDRLAKNRNLPSLLSDAVRLPGGVHSTDPGRSPPSTVAQRAVAHGSKAAEDLAAAKAFRSDTPEQAIKRFPWLAGAYLAMAAFEKYLDTQGVKSETRARAVEAGRTDVAARIERGEAPQVPLNTPITFPVKRNDDVGPDR